MSTPVDLSNPRYVFVDGLRGLAALAVLCHHLLHYTVMGPILSNVLPGPFQWFCVYGSHGVQVFFVISGFVIAHSLRHTEPTGRAVGNFILRRQLRLDPPYWVALAFVLALTAAEALVPGLPPRTLPGVGTVLLNLLYLQNFTGVTQILGVAWTLCLEIQFYLAFILILALSRRLAGRVTADRAPLSAVVLVGGLGVASLLDRGAAVVSTVPFVTSPWFLPFWFYFAAGVLCYWHLRGRLHPAAFWGFVGIFAAVVACRLDLAQDNDDSAVVGFVTVLLFWAVGRAGRLTAWLGDPVSRYFGKISYSLYLVHLPVLSVILRAGYKVSGENRAAAVGWFVAATLASVGAAHLLWALVESPSMRLASRLKRRSPDAAPAIGEPPPTRAGQEEVMA